MALLDAVVDLYYQNAFDAATLKANGILGVAHKRTQGTDFVDPLGAARRVQALAQTLLWMDYGFLNFAPGRPQADKFLQVVNPDGNSALMLDWEAGSRAQAEDYVEWIYRQCGVWPVVYTGLAFANAWGWDNSSPLINCDLFMAYPAAVAQPPIPDLWAKNGKSWSLWQHASNTIAGTMYVDRDYFDGAPDQLTAWWKKASGVYRSVASPKVMLAVPDHLQYGSGADQFKNDCGVACVQDVLDFLHLPYDSDDVMASKTSLARSDSGLYPIELVWLAAQYNLTLAVHTGITSADIRKELDAGRPVIALAYDPLLPGVKPTGDHFLVCVGYDDTNIYVNDPNQSVGTGSGLAIAITDMDNAIAHNGDNSSCVFIVPSSTIPVPITSTPVTEQDQDTHGTYLRSTPVQDATRANVVGSVADGDQISVDTSNVVNGYLPVLAILSGTAKGMFPSALFPKVWIKSSEITADLTPVAPAPPPPLSGHILGVNLDLRNPSGFPFVTKLNGVSWVRLVLKTNYMEGGMPVRASIADTLAFYTPLITAYHAADIKVLMVLNHETFANGCPIWDQSGTWPNFATNFAAVALQVAAHFKGIVSAYEIWNEPDDPGGASIPPVGYGALLHGAIPAIRAGDSEAKVITAGLQGGDPASYLRNVGNLSNPDGIGLHPYLKTGNDLAVIVNSVASFGPVWITEHGYGGNDYTLAAAFMGVAYHSAVQLPVSLYCWYAWSTAMNSSMVCLVDGSQKPNPIIYPAWQALIAQDAQNSPVQTPPQTGGTSGSNGSTPSPSVPPAPVPSPAPSTLDCSEGIHFDDPDLDQQDFLKLVAIFAELAAAGKMVNTITLMFGSTQNLLKWANMIAPYVKFPVIRVKNWDKTWNMDACKTDVDAIAVADHFADVWETLISAGLASNFVIEPNCESDHPVWGVVFALQFMKRMVAINRIAAIFSDSPGQPTLDRLDAAIQNRLPAYQYAGEHGQFISIHCYGDSNKPDTPITDPATFDTGGGYVFQFISRLVKLLPAGSVPRFIITECNRYNSLFVDAQTTVHEQHAYTLMLRQHPFAQYVAGNNWFTYGRSFQDIRYECNAALDAWHQMKALE